MGKFKKAQIFLTSILKFLSIFKSWFLKKVWGEQVGFKQCLFPLTPWNQNWLGRLEQQVSFNPGYALWHMHWWRPCTCIPELHLELLKIHVSKYIESRSHGEEFRHLSSKASSDCDAKEKITAFTMEAPKL